MSDPDPNQMTLTEMAEAIKYYLSDEHRVPSTAHVCLLRKVNEVLPGLIKVLHAAEYQNSYGDCGWSLINALKHFPVKYANEERLG